MRYLGIDPGLTGALALVDEDGRALWVQDTPTVELKGGRGVRHEYELPTIRGWFAALAGPLHVGLERVGAMPDQGVTSMFNMGKGYGLWLGYLGAFGMPFTLVVPVVWKRHYGLIGQDKDASRVLAQQRWPEIDLSLKKHHGRADALFLADFTRIQQQRPQRKKRGGDGQDGQQQHDGGRPVGDGDQNE